ncbi:hypothetical protein [Rossellomorea aquimaris]|uniref:Type 4 fimbrial biogenesis protein PilX N-terminal domain-containing protein n=1 Tax=Rossellomorea aquimaris TaxID=189382 RepID=A0A366EL85_9BACI|nr:hypothetical protein [Rossellomorea aquimaris]RBP02736.1 hypothetical protein DET59_11220 [Rossellomorea aquimaris]
MNDLNNEKGYALVTVLLMMVVFIVISLSFMGQSFSSVKQNKEVEKDYQSVALAEMGVEYFEGKVRNVLKKTEIDGTTNSENLKMKVEESLANEKVEIEGYEMSSYFQITKNDGLTSFTDLNEQKNELFIHFNSLGSSESKESSLHTTMMIPIRIGSTSSKELPEFNQIQKPENIRAECKNPPIIYKSCAEILVLGSGSYPQNHNNLDGKLIYTTGALILDGNANNMDNTKIHTDGSMSLGKNMNNATNVTLEVKGAMSIGGQLRLDSSKVYVGGSMSLDGHMDIEDKSYTYIGGDASISKHLSIGTNSKMCVAGNLKAGQLDIDGKLYVKGSVEGKIKTGQPTYVNHTEFVKNCGVSGSSQTLSIMWDEISTEVDY